MRRLVVVMLALAAMLAIPARAEAHPLGKFSVNQSLQVTISAESIRVLAVIDLAELPTLADKPTASAVRTCSAVATEVKLTIDGTPAAWQPGDATLAYAPGAAGLQTTRYECALKAPAARSTVELDNRYLRERVGWREIVVAGEAIAVDAGDLPTTSPTNGLRDYRQDLLSSPLDVRTASIRIGQSGSAAAFAPLPVGSSWTRRAEQTLEGIVGNGALGLTGVLLAFGLALVLGAAHATLPGHGKTVMAAYLAGRSGRPRDAIVVGATVTFTHTIGVLVLGLLLTVVAGIAGEQVLRALGIISGMLVIAVGLGLLARSRHAHHHHHEHHHTDTHNDRPRSRLSLAGLGVAGGLVPSPTALVVLLAALSLGRGLLGVTLVLAYRYGGDPDRRRAPSPRGTPPRTTPLAATGPLGAPPTARAAPGHRVGDPAGRCRDHPPRRHLLRLARQSKLPDRWPFDELRLHVSPVRLRADSADRRWPRRG